MLRRSWFGACFAGIVAVACSSGGGVSSGACNHLYSALQSYYTRCNVTNVFQAMGSQEDRATKSCEATLSAQGSLTSSGDVDSCASAIEKAPCNSQKATDALTSCTKPGSVANGGPCSSGIQCQSTSCSVSTGDMCGTCKATAKEGEACDQNTTCMLGWVCNASMNGKCAKPTYGPAGAACDVYAARCDDGLRCDGTSKTCVALTASGGSCMSSTECAPPLVCSAQKCADPPGQGGDCSTSFRCANGLVCDITGTKTCVTLTYAKPGQPCSSFTSPCESTLSCPTSKVCPMVIADGQPCNTADMTTTCDYAARCINGVCTLGIATCK